MDQLVDIPTFDSQIVRVYKISFVVRGRVLARSKELVHGGVPHHQLDPVLGVRPVSGLARWTKISSTRTLDSRDLSQTETAEVVVMDTHSFLWVRLGKGANSALWWCRSSVLCNLSTLMLTVMHSNSASRVSTAVVVTMTTTTHTVRAGSGRVESAGTWMGIGAPIT